MSQALLLSVLFPLLVLAQDSSQATGLPAAGYNGGTDNPVDPDDAGAAGGTKGAFGLSSGGLVAIIVVAVVVVIGGIGSASLWWLAKKRQWDVRQSIRRASRRITGRSTVNNTKNRENRRTGIRLNSPPPGKNSKPTQTRDLEKGVPMSSKVPKMTTTITSVGK
ncbi:hypothetical protein P153DRAFT_371318 [Dothidotthia symphoricarpi CBS 119687]|uniref:Transmembrane protein n=1 Tax=Dothidotthia symphoricarpi CBS 119687 TaxID=1392245 RepID=A0A6A5ZYN6_9PLEO|nr:uncharacterized protein P153DRAFT_371318 [Dothidotthia symphoricarpi CBS 119687]KAF2124014.1 hypothetical protein P153DRAFT_371318 [Dothidotthia symphoricarpi CBS 119687]